MAFAILAFAVVLSSLFPFTGGHQPLARSVYPQERPPVIHTVDPEPPHCALRNSEIEEHRILTITGEYLQYIEGRHLQFLLIGVGQDSLLIGLEVDWESADRITVDMNRLDHLLWPYGKMVLRVRVTDERGVALSDWSPRFNVASHVVACGVSRSTRAPTPVPAPTPFPPTPPIRGVAGDLWADVIIGKPDFAQIAPKSVVPFKVFNPGGVVVDRSVEPGRAYIWDASNSRILGIDLAGCYESGGTCAADVVIGQPSGYDQSACNGDSGVQNFPVRAAATAQNLCGLPDVALSPWESFSFVTMAVDSLGSLFVPDSMNHRILKYESPFESDSTADEVWGQADFSGMVCNRGAFVEPSAETLCFHSPFNRSYTNWYGNGVEIDPNGNMWVADGGNNRVLRFPADPENGEIAKAADLVLGQPDFNSAEHGDTLDRLHGPSAVRVGSDGRAYVADTINNRVLVFKPPFQTGMRADMVFGSRFHRPTSLEIDPFGRGIWVVNAGNYMAELWNVTGTSVLRVLGKDSYRPDRACGPPMAGVPGRPRLCPMGGSIGLDGWGNVLVPAYHGASDVYRFPTLSPQTDGNQTIDPDRRLSFLPSRTISGTERAFIPREALQFGRTSS